MAQQITLTQFVGALNRMPMAIDAAARLGLDRAARRIVKEAQHRVGEYQEAEGPFAAWSELSEATKEERRRAGYSDNDPLLRDGTLRDAITHTVESGMGKHKATIGVKHAMVSHGYSSEPVDIGMVAAVQERGNAHVPPRSFIGGAGYLLAPVVRDIVGHAVAAAIAGKPLSNR